jgi:hypothetical protein
MTSSRHIISTYVRSLVLILMCVDFFFNHGYELMHCVWWLVDYNHVL